jgi:hypothetical protein
MTEVSLKDTVHVNGGVWPAILAGYFVGQAAAELLNKINDR